MSPFAIKENEPLYTIFFEKNFDFFMKLKKTIFFTEYKMKFLKTLFILRIFISRIKINFRLSREVNI